MNKINLAILALSMLSTAPAATLTLANPNISGAPGETIGWGFTLSSPTHHLTIANVTLLPASTLGTFTDLLSPRLTFEAGPSPSPASSVTEAFNGLGAGLGSFAIDGGATPGSVANAILYVVYNLYNVSPNHDAAFDPFDPAHIDAEGLIFEIPVSVTVTNTPEPSTLALTALAAGGLLLLRRRR